MLIKIILVVGGLFVALFQGCSPFEASGVSTTSSVGLTENNTPTVPEDEADDEPVLQETPDLTDERMSFFVTSVSLSSTGNLGGVEAADNFCNMLGTASGTAGNWRAYLSRTNADGTPMENARDRIGVGPWFNQNEVMIAANLDQLHNATIPANLMLNDQGALTPGQMHDILTGSDAQGRAVAGNCQNWTSSSVMDSSVVGHVDLMGRDAVQSWNSIHSSTCDAAGVARNAGAGLFYCFRIR